MTLGARFHGVSPTKVHSHAKKHNKEFMKLGECPMCRREESEYSKHQRDADNLRTRGYSIYSPSFVFR